VRSPFGEERDETIIQGLE
jgi:hypothetical protein